MWIESLKLILSLVVLICVLIGAVVLAIWGIEHYLGGNGFNIMEKAKSLRGKQTCPKCGQETPKENLSFCPSCGAILKKKSGRERLVR
ncbi:MAG: hypothetical protein OEY47_07525 [Candidatus Bathyarchaeota archaeon]|nr:hypothetical protein [Candidatus Bathyarchaeota archaeon]